MKRFIRNKSTPEELVREFNRNLSRLYLGLVQEDKEFLHRIERNFERFDSKSCIEGTFDLLYHHLQLELGNPIELTSPRDFMSLYAAFEKKLLDSAVHRSISERKKAQGVTSPITLWDFFDLYQMTNFLRFWRVDHESNQVISEKIMEVNFEFMQDVYEAHLRSMSLFSDNFGRWQYSRYVQRQLRQ
jgi:hypothetical protein